MLKKKSFTFDLNGSNDLRVSRSLGSRPCGWCEECRAEKLGDVTLERSFIMSSDITLSAAVRSTLLFFVSTIDLVERTTRQPAGLADQAAVGYQRVGLRRSSRAGYPGIIQVS